MSDFVTRLQDTIPTGSSIALKNDDLCASSPSRLGSGVSIVFRQYDMASYDMASYEMAPLAYSAP